MGNQRANSTVDLPIPRCQHCLAPVVVVRTPDGKASVAIEPRGVTVGDLVFDAKKHRRHRCQPMSAERAA